MVELYQIHRLTRALGLAGAVLLFSGCATMGFGNTAEDHADAASTALKDGDYDAALEHLRILRADHAETDPGQRAMLDEAFIHYRQGRTKETVELTTRFLDNHLETASADDHEYALRLRALAAEQTWDKTAGDTEQTHLARRAFGFHREVVEAYPESDAARESLRAMEKLRDDLASAELQRARAALEGGELAEAAERAAWIAEQYRSARHAGPALALQSEALDKLGHTREASATRRMLDVLYPEHARN